MAEQASRPNILLIMTDQQRYDTLGATGNPLIRTPHLDRLAAQGAVFETAITPSAVCVPARAALMTGHAPSRIHFTNNGGFLADQDDTLPALLGRAGYCTQALGKMHFKHRPGGLVRPWEATYGFQHLILSEETRWVRQAQDLESVSLDDYDRYLQGLGLWGWDVLSTIGYNQIKPVISPLPEEYGVTAWLGNLTVDWLRNHRREPFFLFVSFVKPHPPFDPPEEWAGLYDPHQVPAPVRSPRELERENPHYALERERRRWDLYSAKAERISRAYYYANISLVDKYVGQILDALDELGLRQRTYVIFTSDHGDLLGDHWLWGKTFAYDGCTRVPLMVAGPDVAQGARIDGCVVNTLDVSGTILARAGLPIPADRPCRDLLDYLRPEHPRPEYAVTEVGPAGRRCRALRSREWLYVHWENGGYEELYDLRSDPQQLENLAHDAPKAALRRELRAALIEWLCIWGDAAWELDAHGDLSAHEFTGPQAQRWLPRPGGVTPAEFTEPARCWSREDDWWPWRWRAVNGDYRQFLELAKRLYGGGGECP